MMIQRSSKRFIKSKVKQSLEDMLDKHERPKIDYLSIDTEGEFDILKDFDFEKYDIKIITCEHNFANQEKIYFHCSLLMGIKKTNRSLKIDDWYVKRPNL